MRTLALPLTLLLPPLWASLLFKALLVCALCTLSIEIAPQLFGTYDIQRAKSLLDDGLIWPLPRTIDSTPLVTSNGLVERALRYIAAAEHSRLHSALPYQMAGWIYAARAEWSLAGKSFEQAHMLAPHNQVVVWDMSVIYSHMSPELGTPDDVHRIMEQLWLEAGLGPTQFLARGDQARQKGQMAVALKWYKRVLQMNPAQSEAWHSLGLIYVTLQNSTEAVQAYGKAAQLSPEDRDIWYELAQVYVKQKSWELALNAYMRGSRAHRGHVGRSVMLLRTGDIRSQFLEPSDLGGAWANYEEALRLDDYTGLPLLKAETYLQQGHILVKEKHLQEGLEAFQHAILLDPHQYWAHVALADTFQGLGRTKEARLVAQKAIELDPGQKYGYKQLGDFYTLSGDVQEARTMYDKALAIDPQYWDARAALQTLH